MKQVFLEKAFWLCGNFPGICRRSYFGQWLISCLQKKGDKDGDNAAKRKAVERILQYLELPQREGFEHDLIQFVKHFSLHAPMRFRECSSRIEDGTDWGRTFQKSLVETPGRLCSFINYSRKYELDYVTRNSLILLALEMAKELRSFASLIDGLGAPAAFSQTTGKFWQRAKALEELSHDCGRFPQYFNHERVDYALRRTLEGRRLADNIAGWIFTPEWNFKLETPEHSNAGLLLEDLKLNEDKLFEIIATITSIQILQEKLHFRIVKCDISEDKPVIQLQKGDLFCQVRKNFDAQDEVDDELIHFRTVGNKPTGLQPDIVYKFWKIGVKPVYRLGDAKNYNKGSDSDINYPVALYAMMHYLIAYRKALGITDEEVIPLLSKDNGKKNPAEAQRIVVFFSKPSQKHGEKQYPQPCKGHPLLFVYGKNAQTDANGGCHALVVFFSTAIDELENKSRGKSQIRRMHRPASI